MEIHDSVLNRVSITQGVAELHFSSVYIHESEGAPGIDPGIGWFQPAILRIFDGAVVAKLPGLPVDLTDGQIVLGEVVRENIIPLPLDYRGKIEFQLIPKWDSKAVLLFRGSGAELTLIGEPGEIENFGPK